MTGIAYIHFIDFLFNRKQFDLLHKGEKLLRDLKHLDSQRW